MIGAIIAKQSVSSAFAALNRRDLASFMKTWSKDATWVYPGDLSVSGKFVGKSAVQGWFEKFMQQYPKIQFTVNNICVANIFALGGNNAMAAQWDLALTNRQGAGFQNSGVTVLTIKNAQVVLGRDYLQQSGGEDFRRIWGE